MVDVIVWTCVTVGVLIGLCAIVLSVISARNMKKSREQMRQLQDDIKVGAKIMFAGGIFGKITGIHDDKIEVELNKNNKIQISRFSIQEVIKPEKKED